MALEVIHRQPQADTRPTPLLFVHGAWHGAWCWDEYFLPYFAQNGYQSYALSLRGHGNSPNNKMLRLTGIWDYVDDVAQVASQIEADHGVRPVIIAHSMGGYVTQKYLERHTAPAVVLVATIPVMGTLPLTFRWMRTETLSVLHLTLTLSGYPIVNTPEKAHRLLFSASMPRETVEKYQMRLGDEAIRILLDVGIVNLPKPKKIKPTPILVLAAENDAVFPVSEEQKTAQAYGTEAVIFPNLAHDTMLEAGWQNVADHILSWLAERGL